MNNAELNPQEALDKGLQSDPVTAVFVTGLLIILALFLLAALLNMAEAALFTLHDKDKENPDNRWNTVKSMFPSRKPSAVVISIWVARILIYASIILIFLHLSDYLPNNLINPLPAFLFPIITAFLIILFCEFVPRFFGVKYPYKVIHLLRKPLSFLPVAFRPWSALMVSLARFVDEKSKGGNLHSFSSDEISQVLERASDHEITSEKEILEGIVSFGNKSVAEIMCPRPDVVAVDIRIPYTAVLEVINNSGYSRIPVFSDSFDQIKGILYIKDLLQHTEKGDEFSWQKLLRPPFFVPETRKVKNLLEDFQKNKIHMAVVVDEYGGSSGIVTLEDILEEIVGDIADEFDEEESYFTRLGEGIFLFDGKTPLQKFIRPVGCKEDYFDDVKGDADTLAGLLLEINGDIPTIQQNIHYKEFRFIIELVTHRRIQQVRVEKESHTGSADKGSSPVKFFILILLILMTGCLTFCHEKIVPKPHGYFRIDFPPRNYQSLPSGFPYHFDFPAYSSVIPDNSASTEPFWINLYFPSFHATLHISYKKVKENLYLLTEESHKLAYDHAIKASSIQEKIFMNPGKKVYGTIYHINGNAASPMQFYLTDSTLQFLRGAFYISATPNIDSLKPVIEFIKTDIIHLIETFEWMNQ